MTATLERPRVGSLFSGIGGLDLAVEAFFGAETAWHCEWDAEPSKVLAARWPGVPNYRDVTKVDWEAVEPVDIMCGGFPCQDVSLAGRRRGMKDGTRSGLWSEFARAIDIVRPSVVVIENVRGLISARAERGTPESERHCGVCGWTDRRGGQHRSARADASGTNVLHGSSADRDVEARDAGAGADARDVGRKPLSDTGAIGALGGSVDVDDIGSNRSGVPGADTSPPSGEGRAGGRRDGAGSAESRTAAERQRRDGLEPGAREGVCSVEDATARDESEGAECPECGGELIEAPGDVEQCPWCVGDGSDEYHLRALDAVLADLSDLGFDAEWGGLRAADVGAPHGRYRFFILAYARGVRRGTGWNPVPGEAPRGRASALVGGRPDASVKLLGAPRTAQGMVNDSRDPQVIGNPRGRLEDQIALLPTPVTAPDTGNGHARNLGSEVKSLLPTVVTTDAEGSRRHTTSTGASHTGTTLTDALLPTPLVSDAKGHAEADDRRDHPQLRRVAATGIRRGASATPDNPDAVAWGDYEPAVRQWEAITRAAPMPTTPDGKNGNHRLSARFTEWMMGYPDGWITDIIRRNPAIKACGNGVVPQQAYAAIEILWARLGVPLEVAA